MPLLTQAELETLGDSALNAGLANPNSRMALVADASPRFVATIPILASPVNQLKMDLRKLNEAENLPDGSVPLLTWLKNAEESTYGSPAAKSFATIFARIASRAPGANRAVDLKPKDAGGKELVIGRNDLLPFSYFQNGLAAGKAVAKILVPIHENEQPVLTTAGQPSTAGGTCWLLTSVLVVTNHHVIDARAPGETASARDLAKQVESSTIQFDYDFGTATGEVIQVDELVISDAVLDFAVLRLKKDSKRRPLRVSGVPMKFNAANPPPVNIIQHPNGDPKQIGVRNNLVNDSSADELTYFTDTMYGSSGSPVCDDSWRVVALHRGFQPVTNVSFQGKSTAYANYGTHIFRVLERLQAVRQNDWKQIVLEQPGLEILNES